MAYKFTLDDDDEINDLSAPALDDPDIRAMRLSDISAKPPAKAPWTPDVRQRDPAMDQQWSLAESDSLQRSRYNPSDYGVGEGVRDFGGLALAGILDAVANKGRGIVNIAAANQGNMDKYEALRRQDAKDQGEFALKARAAKDNDYQNALRVKQIQQQDERIGLAGLGEQRRTGTYDRAMNTENPVLKAQKDQLVRQSNGKITAEDLASLDGEAIKGLMHGYNADIDSAKTPQKAADEATVAGARTRAVEGVQLGYVAPTEVEKGKGRAVAEEIERPGVVKTAGAQSEATTAGREKVERPLREQERGEAFQEKYAKDNKALLGARDALGSVLNGLPEGGTPEGFDYKSRIKDKVGLGSLNSPGAQATQQKLSIAATAVIHDQSGAAFSSKEAAQNFLNIMGDPLASPEDRTSATRRFAESVDADLRGQAVRPKDAEAVIQRRGSKPLTPTSAPAVNKWSQYEE